MPFLSLLNNSAWFVQDEVQRALQDIQLELNAAYVVESQQFQKQQLVMVRNCCTCSLKQSDISFT